MDVNSLSHTKWNCKYHIVYALKFRRKIAYGQSGSLSRSPRIEIGCGSRKVGWKTHDMVQEGAYVRSTYLGCVRRYTTERKRGGNTRAEENKKEKTKKETNRKSPRKLFHKFPG